MGKNKYVPILDPGHGGVIFGHYQTPGKRSPEYEGYPVLYEGAFNRAIVARIIEKCDMHGIPYSITTMEVADMPLSERVRVAERRGATARSMGYEPYLISVHANAARNRETGYGYEVYTSPGQTTSDIIATMWYNHMGKIFPEARGRPGLGDGDPDKEAKFTVLMRTKIPAILTENFFMNHRKDFECYLMSPEARDNIAQVHFNMIHELYKNGIKN